MANTQVIIMAAGLGSRLKDLTTATPKALIEAGDRPLIDYALAFSRAAGATRQIVVGGFHHGDVAARVAKVAPEAVLVENTEYKKGNLISMLTGAAALEPGDFLLMNTDHIYRPTIAEVVAKACTGDQITAFCDFDRTLGADDMKVGLDDQRRVATMSKQLTTWDCGYVGMTFVPAARRTEYLAAASRVREELGEATHVESILVHFAKQGTPPIIADISGHGWLEIDEPHERAHADEVLARERWWA
ncbi:MAG: NTP transferase domain-containing protein [Myxococcales bacterium]|nr:NTP transferase domain-containing protein [Myxococcales bacterium]